ncbi:hypothetical protein RIF29_00721 [Crotalaria pallida]|uniref:Uncharacterized protein n=1 Tax=Crotalaria pallida TaxID=3830 RepID=A0AAN9IX01_CROPI
MGVHRELSDSDMSLKERCSGRLDMATVQKFTVHDNRESVKESSAAGDFVSEEDFICSSIELDSINSIGEGFLSDTNFGTTFELNTLRNNEYEGLKEDLEFGKVKKLENFPDIDIDIIGELRKLEEESRLQNSEVNNIGKLRENFRICAKKW